MIAYKKEIIKDIKRNEEYVKFKTFNELKALEIIQTYNNINRTEYEYVSYRRRKKDHQIYITVFSVKEGKYLELRKDNIEKNKKFKKEINFQ